MFTGQIIIDTGAVGNVGRDGRLALSGRDHPRAAVFSPVAHCTGDMTGASLSVG
jgi:hypothetical protein